MGFFFKVEHANLVAYVTQVSTEHARPAPRSDRDTLLAFFRSLSETYSLEQGFAETKGRNRFRRLVSGDDKWRSYLIETARKLELQVETSQQDFYDSADVAHLLQRVRAYFERYDIYALVLPSGDWQQDYETHQFFREVALSSQTSGLVLMPSGASALTEIVDPFPVFKALADQPLAPPAVAFWTDAGTTAVMPLASAKRFYRNEIMDRWGDRHGINECLRRQAAQTRTKRLLHMSDLHFGRPEAARRRRYLKGHLSTLLRGIDRVVVTGDLFDDPDETYRDEFEEFRTDIRRMVNHDLIVVPGNHDVRRRGNALGKFGKNYEVMADIPFRPLVADDELEVVFYCFNSSEGGDFARGRISDRQRLARAAEYDELLSSQPEIADYVKVALVHHHPCAYDTVATTLYDKILRRLTGREDTFIAFENAEEFLKWCGGRDVSLILHGHKHVPRQKQARVSVRGQDRDLTVIGCGSTTGVENTPMCYDIVTLDSESRRWGAQFYHDVAADGSGFELQTVVIDLRAD